MGYVVAAVAQGAQQFDYGVAHDEPFGLDGHGNGYDEQALVGEGHAEAQEYAIDSAGSTHGGPVVEVGAHGHDDAVDVDLLVAAQSLVGEFNPLRTFLHEAGAYAAHNIVEEESLRTHHLLHDAAEHPNGEHVEEDVLPACVHEHVGEELVEPEVGGLEKVEAQQVVEVYAVAHGHQFAEKHQQVDDYDILCYRGYVEHNR